MLEHRGQFENALYDPAASMDDVLTQSHPRLALKLWTEYYCRYNPEVVVPEQEVSELTYL